MTARISKAERARKAAQLFEIAQQIEAERAEKLRAIIANIVQAFDAGTPSRLNDAITAARAAI